MTLAKFSHNTLYNNDKNIFYMRKALKQAACALQRNEVPVGAVIVDANGCVIARAYNKVECMQQQSAHAEILAIQRASKKTGSWRLNGCWIYVTLEPCLMCIGLIQMSRLQGIVYGAPSLLFGNSLYRNNNAQVPTYAKQLQIIEGVMKDESIEMLKKFFQNMRKKRRNTHEAKS